jgi:hypothetical protein
LTIFDRYKASFLKVFPGRPGEAGRQEAADDQEEDAPDMPYQSAGCQTIR